MKTFAAALISLPFVFPQPLVAQQSAEPEVYVFESGYGYGAFEIADSAAATSAAIELSTGNPFTVTNKVMVLTNQPDLLREMARELDQQARQSNPNNTNPALSLTATSHPEVFQVAATTVAAAIDVCNALEPIFGTKRVHLNCRPPLANRSLPNDPLFGDQWHLLNTIDPHIDSNADAAWNRGFTGAGVVIGIVDSGASWGHEDLAANYNSAASTTLTTSVHGSGVAGVAAAVEGNGLGVVGMAYDSQWGNMIYGDAATTATNLLHANDLNDLKNCSWGPFDDATMWTMSPTEYAAIEQSIQTGRGGLGQIFVWAAGNGGSFDDRTDYDPYASTRYSICIGSIGDADVRANNNETGSSMMAVTHTSGNTRKITTTSQIGYSTTFGGSSSAAPLASGMMALAVQANPTLTWRDAQHLVVHSARMVDPADSNWKTNGAGHEHNENYGFGALDADALVVNALNWTNVSPVQVETSGQTPVNLPIPDNDSSGLEFTIPVTSNMLVEHAELILNVDHNKIGDLKIFLRSPNGIRSLFTKKRGDTKDDLVDYIFTTVRSWDELAAGDWTIHISDEEATVTGILIDYELRVYGNDGSHLNDFRIADVQGLTQGASSTLTVAGARAHEKCWAVFSTTGPGVFSVPQLGLDLDLDNPVLINMYQITDAAGQASFTRGVPPTGSSGLSIWFQAMQLGSTSSVYQSVIQ
jgi:subtilisin-like proprotein convertase family protein